MSLPVDVTTCRCLSMNSFCSETYYVLKQYTSSTYDILYFTYIQDSSMVRSNSRSWFYISAEINTLVNSMRRQCTAVVNSRCGYFRYYYFIFLTLTTLGQNFSQFLLTYGHDFCTKQCIMEHSLNAYNNYFPGLFSSSYIQAKLADAGLENSTFRRPEITYFFRRASEHFQKACPPDNHDFLSQ